MLNRDDPIVQFKLAMLERCLPAPSAVVFGDVWGVDGGYTIVGNVESGMEHVDAIKRGDQAQNGTVTDPDRMISVRIAADGQ